MLRVSIPIRRRRRARSGESGARPCGGIIAEWRGRRRCRHRGGEEIPSGVVQDRGWMRSCAGALLDFYSVGIEIAIGRHLLDKPILKTPDLGLQPMGGFAAEHPAVTMRHHETKRLNEPAGPDF